MFVKILRFARHALRRVFSGAPDTSTDATPAKYVNTLRNLEADCGSLDGKTILEVGSDPAGRFLRYLSAERKPASAVGINPAVQTEQTDGPVVLRRADARAIPYPDNHFDLIMSVSVLEHVQDLDVALAEMHRVLKPGGYLFSEFGPIWSSCWGHHLWFTHAGQEVTWLTHRLPPYAHLLMDEDEVRAWCTDAYGDASLAAAISDYVYHSDEQNRLFYSDYERLVAASPFERLYFVGIPDVPFRKGYECDDSRAVFRALRERYPDEPCFGYHVVCMLLTKSA